MSSRNGTPKSPASRRRQKKNLFEEWLYYSFLINAKPELAHRRSKSPSAIRRDLYNMEVPSSKSGTRTEDQTTKTCPSSPNSSGNLAYEQRLERKRAVSACTLRICSMRMEKNPKQLNLHVQKNTVRGKPCWTMLIVGHHLYRSARHPTSTTTGVGATKMIHSISNFQGSLPATARVIRQWRRPPHLNESMSSFHGDIRRQERSFCPEASMGGQQLFQCIEMEMCFQSKLPSRSVNIITSLLLTAPGILISRSLGNMTWTGM